MTALPRELQKRIDEIAGDRLAGASEILDRAIALLLDVQAADGPVRAVARALCDAQPSMAGMWNAGLHAVAGREDPSVFTAFTARVNRAERALIRVGLEFFEAGANAPLRLATFSFSRTAAALITALSETREVRVAAAEGRPMLEGRRMATALAAAGARVTFYTDAALGQALGAVDAVLVGADAITPDAVINKSGTRLLAAAAAHQGVPVYVAASREKFVSQAVSLQLAVREGHADEVWPTPPAGVEIRNPYFEPTPLDLVASVITDTGVIGAGLVPEVCEASSNVRWVAELLGR
ncbi:MAG: hypothetical protein AB7P99_17270 [Vicinamibacterales bacterium]